VRVIWWHVFLLLQNAFGKRGAYSTSLTSTLIGEEPKGRKNLQKWYRKMWMEWDGEDEKKSGG